MKVQTKPDKPKILVIGLGPGSKDEITDKAAEALKRCDIVVGYSVYIDIVNEIMPGKETRSFPMKHELERCRYALETALSGATVGVVSSGDPGVYGMAGIMLELVHDAKIDVEVEVVAGITACCSAAARIGAPLGHDFAVVSLSDLLTPWDVIEKRLLLAAEGDFVICLYNPSSKKRGGYLKRACDVIKTYRAPGTPSAWVRMAGRESEEYRVLSLDELANAELDMFCTVFIGNSTTRSWGDKMVTPRGYNVAGAGA